MVQPFHGVSVAMESLEVWKRKMKQTAARNLHSSDGSRAWAGLGRGEAETAQGGGLFVMVPPGKRCRIFVKVLPGRRCRRFSLSVMIPTE